MTVVETRKPFFFLAGIFITFICLLGLIYHIFPKLDAEEVAHFKYPRNLDDAKDLGRILSNYKEKHYFTMMCGIIVIYVMLQSFAIPGSIFLSILSGYLFSFTVALALICSCSALGATICYLLSYLFGRKLVMRYFPERVATWQEEISNHHENLFNYIVFLRVTPILPNWFINIASPVINVPLAPFFWGTFFGVAPPSFLFIQAGTTLELMTHTNVAWSWNSIALLSFFAILSLLPVLYRKVGKAKSD